MVTRRTECVYRQHLRHEMPRENQRKQEILNPSHQLNAFCITQPFLSLCDGLGIRLSCATVCTCYICHPGIHPVYTFSPLLLLLWDGSGETIIIIIYISSISTVMIWLLPHIFLPTRICSVSLIHIASPGLYGFDVRGPSSFPKLQLHYWSNVLRILKKRIGAEVIVTGVPGFASHFSHIISGQLTHERPELDPSNQELNAWIVSFNNEREAERSILSHTPWVASIVVTSSHIVNLKSMLPYR